MFTKTTPVALTGLIVIVIISSKPSVMLMLVAEITASHLGTAIVVLISVLEPLPST